MARWRLREIAEPKGWNPHSLAIEAKLSYNTVRPIWFNEAKRADLDTLAKLVKTLGIAPGQLIGNDGTAEDTPGNSLPALLTAALAP